MADQLDRYRWLIVGIFTIPMLVGVVALLQSRTGDRTPIEIGAHETVPTDIRVYVAGAVKNPGVYPLADGDRWIDALEAAGGPLEDADLARVNLARRARDEDQVSVPRVGQPGSPAGGAGFLMDINSASERDLEGLTGIGEVRAQAIVSSRTIDGPFKSIEDLLTRKLLPKSVFEDISLLITIGQ